MRERAGRLCKADLATDMVRELTELQGTMGGIYAREEGLPEEVWKAIYFHYLPIGVEADAHRRGSSSARRRSRGRRSRSPTSSIRSSGCSGRASGRPARAIRLDCGARRRGRVKILADLPELTGLDSAAPTLGPLLERAAEPFTVRRRCAV